MIQCMRTGGICENKFVKIEGILNASKWFCSEECGAIYEKELLAKVENDEDDLKKIEKIKSMAIAEEDEEEEEIDLGL